MKILFNNFNISSYPKSKVHFGNSYTQDPFYYLQKSDSFKLQQKPEEYYDEKIKKEYYSNIPKGSAEEKHLMEEIAAIKFLDHFEMAFPIIPQCLYDDKEEAQIIFDLSLTDISPKSAKRVKDILSRAGIDTIRKMKKVLDYQRQLDKSGKLSTEFALEFFDIYSSLENPKDMSNFPKTLLLLCMINQNEEDPIDTDMFVQRAKAIGIKNENEVKEKYPYLAPSFNDFEMPSDVACAMEYLIDTYSTKILAINLCSFIYPEISSVNGEEFYKKHGDLVDYLYEVSKKSFASSLYELMCCFNNQNTNIQPHAAEALKGFVDIKKPQGKIELLRTLREEDITVSELNELTKTKYISDIDLSEVIFSKREIVSEFEQIVSRSVCNILYTKFAQTLISIFNSDDNNSDLMADFFFACAKFEIQSDKEFVNFFLNVARPETKASKKKGQKQNTKVTQKDVVNFIHLLEFADKKMVEKYKNNNKYPLYLDLERREAQYNKIKKPLEEEFKKQGYKHLIPASRSIFINYHDSYEANPDVAAFAQSVINAKKEAQEEQIFDTGYRQFLEYFEDEQTLEEFLYKNDIDTLNDNNGRAQLYLKILHALLSERDDKEKQELKEKFLKSKFFENSNKHLASIISSKSEEEIRTLFEIILSENIESERELKAIFKPYRGKSKELGAFLQHFKASGMDFRSYIEKISQIQKEFLSTGLDIVLNNDNIGAISQEDLKEGKLTLERMTEIAKEILNPDSSGNFICGYDNALVEKDLRYNSESIAREISAGQGGRFKEGYEKIVSKLGLDCKSLGARSVNDENYRALLSNKIASEGKLIRLINSKEWLNIFNDDKKPNLTLHAKMRLIERFILDTQDGDSLSQKETIEKLKDILTTIYTKTPTKIKKSNSGNAGFAAFFEHDGYEVKAVFAADGHIITVAKNEL